jgi:protein arginine N-methyltransferase 1
VFSLAELGQMIADGARLDAHAAALRRVVRPGAVVLDLGAGTGIMSLLACQAGARRVYAVEPSDAVHIAAAAARDNGFAERVVVVQGRSTDLTLPERADVIVSDLRGVLPPHGTHFADLIDARARLLAPGGWMMPARDTLRVAVVSALEAFAERRGVWLSHPHGLELGAALRYVDNAAQKHRARVGDLLGAPASWARLEYATLTELGVRGEGTLTASRPGAAHGLLLWFDAELVDGIGHSSAPGSPGDIYGQVLLPWPEEVALDAGDRVAFELRADPVGRDYLWTWATEIRRAADGAVAARFRQSTFDALPRSREAVRARAAASAPALSAAGADALVVLEGMRDGATVEELAARLFAAHPERHPTLAHAQGVVAALADRFGRSPLPDARTR